MTLVLGGLMFHSLLYAFSELRQASKGKPGAQAHASCSTACFCYAYSASWLVGPAGFVHFGARWIRILYKSGRMYIYNAANPESGQALFRSCFMRGTRLTVAGNPPVDSIRPEPAIEARKRNGF